MQVHGPGPLPRKGLRRLHIEGVEYLYVIKGRRVQFLLEDRKVIADLSEVSGKPWDIIERGQYKKTNDGYVTPAHCKAFLERFLNDNSVHPIPDA